MMMTYTYKMEIGDWSHDGHNQSEVFVLGTSHKNSEIQKAYVKACKKGEIELHGHGPNSVCTEYEDNFINKDGCQKLINLGLDLNNLPLESGIDDEFDDGSLFCHSKDIVILFMEMAKTQLPDLTYKIISDKMEEIQAPNHSFIGYGCFS